MRYLDTGVLQQLEREKRLETGAGRARQRGYVWLVWMQPHLRNGIPRVASRHSTLRWPVYRLHGRAAA